MHILYNTILVNILNIKLFEYTQESIITYSGDNNIFKKHFNSNSIFLFNDTNFFDIEFLISKSNLLIASHGAVTHVAASLNIRIFDIIDDSENIFFDKWTSHFKRYKKFVRKDFNSLSKEIINHL